MRIRNHRWSPAPLAVTFLVSTACFDRPEYLDRPVVTDGPLVAGTSIFIANRNAGTITTVDPDARRARATELSKAVRAVASAGTKALALANDGLDPRLFVLDVASGELESLEVPAAFDRISSSPDGAFAVLSYSGDGTPAPGAPAARNPNELAIVSLASKAVTAVRLESESLAPRSVRFDASSKRAAIVLSSGVSVVELATPEKRLDVPLELTSGDELTPVEAELLGDGSALIMRAAGTNDVIALSIEDAGTELRGSINFLFAPATGALLDFALPAGSLSGQIAAVYAGPSGGGVAALLSVDGDAAKTRTARLTRQLGRIDSFDDGALLIHDAPEAGESGRGGEGVAVWLPLEDQVQEDTLGGPVSGPARIGPGVATFSRATGAALTVLSTSRRGARLEIDLRPIGLGGDLSATGGNGDEYLAAVTVPREGSGAAPNAGDDEDFSGATGAIVVLSESGSKIEGLPLDDTILEVGRVGAWLYARHPDAFLELTFVTRAKLERAAAFRVDGLALGLMLERGGEELR